MFFEIKDGNSALTVDYKKGTVLYEGISGAWRMPLKPHVVLSGGRRSDFPAPCAAYAKESATSHDVWAEYAGIPGTALRAYTRISLEKITGDLRFEIRIEDDLSGEVEYLSYPSAWVLEGAGSYTVLPRMQGELVPLGSDLAVEKGQIFDAAPICPCSGRCGAKKPILPCSTRPLTPPMIIKPAR